MPPRDPPAPEAPGASLAELVARLDDQRPTAVAICGIANARLAHDVALSHAMTGAAPDTPFTPRSRSCLTRLRSRPGALAAAAASRGYTVGAALHPPGSPEGRFDALLRQAGERARWPVPHHGALLTNDPLGDELAGRLRRDLQASLDAVLGARGKARILLGSAPTR